MSDNSFSRPKSLLTRQNYLEWTRDQALCLPSYGIAGDEVTKQKATIEFLHKPLVGDRMWQIEEDENGGEVWVQVEMTEYQKRQVPTRLATWKSEYEKYKKARGALINNIKAEQLIKSASLSKYESIIGNWVLMIEQP